MIEILSRPWPWYIAGPLMGLFVPLLLLLGNKSFGISSNLIHICAAVAPCGIDFFRYDWKKVGLWNLCFLAGIMIGGFIGGWLLGGVGADLSPQTQTVLKELGVRDLSGLVPGELFGWSNLLTIKGLIVAIGGGFLVGFGTAYAGGCTSGHAIFGLSSGQLPSLIAVMGFFCGGLIATFFILPVLL
ncbi:MAG: YeeE/YedE family protein [candidate division Zixibacteria bacterium]|nr:YeeE/YedE family protein [candidate division Zixibacteria bacterium]